MRKQVCKCVDMLIETGANVNPKTNSRQTILILAVENEKYVESLIQSVLRGSTRQSWVHITSQSRGCLMP